MPRIAYASFILSTLALTYAQTTLLSPTLPACASTCPVLIQAQSGCVPPAAPVTNQATYQSCFCQSGYLTSLKSSNNNICAPQCSDSDFAAIDTWYKSLCGGNNAAGQATIIATLTPTPTTTLATATTAAVSPTTSAPQVGAGDIGIDPGDNPSKSGAAWFASHWRWIVMLIVLFVGLALLGLVATLLHRRYVRRRDAAENAGPHPTLETWGPNGHSVHDFGQRGPSIYGVQSVADREKGKGREGDVTVHETPSSRRGSGKLKKGKWLARKSG